MKCTKCGKNEANFHYMESINGKKTEAHLCADCAREEGYEQSFNDFGLSNRGFFGDMFDEMLSPAGFFSDPFENGFGLLSPMRSFSRGFGGFPQIQISIGDRGAQRGNASLVETDQAEKKLFHIDASPAAAAYRPAFRASWIKLPHNFSNGASKALPRATMTISQPAVRYCSLSL